MPAPIMPGRPGLSSAHWMGASVVVSSGCSISRRKFGWAHSTLLRSKTAVAARATSRTGSSASWGAVRSALPWLPSSTSSMPNWLRSRVTSIARAPPIDIASVGMTVGAPPSTGTTRTVSSSRAEKHHPAVSGPAGSVRMTADGRSVDCGVSKRPRTVTRRLRPLA